MDMLRLSAGFHLLLPAFFMAYRPLCRAGARSCTCPWPSASRSRRQRGCEAGKGGQANVCWHAWESEVECKTIVQWGEGHSGGCRCEGTGIFGARMQEGADDNGRACTMVEKKMKERAVMVSHCWNASLRTFGCLTFYCNRGLFNCRRRLFVLVGRVARGCARDEHLTHRRTFPPHTRYYRSSPSRLCLFLQRKRLSYRHV